MIGQNTRFYCSHIGLPFLLGAASVLGFAPFYFFPVPVITLACLFGLWAQCKKSKWSFLIGYAYGLGLFSTGVSWIYVSLHDFGNMPSWLAIVATALFCMVLALYPALAGLVQSSFQCGKGIKAVLIVPAVWVVSEWLRGWLFTGFPWLAVGYAQAPQGPLVGYAPILGVYGVSLFVALSSGLVQHAFYLCWQEKKRLLSVPVGQKIFWLGTFAAIWIVGFLSTRVDWTQSTGKPVSVSLLQGNIAQDLKWQEYQALKTLELYRGMVLGSNSRLIILPETALPYFYDSLPQDYLNDLVTHARSQKGDLLVGIPERTIRDPGFEYFNSVFNLGYSENQVYRKYHLVPFGEFIPIKPVFGWIIRVLHIPLSDFSSGKKDAAPLAAAGERLAVNICYEDAFGEEIIRQLPDATLLVNVSNDAWFGRSVAAYQHLQISQMRSIETGRYMLRATNTGITAIINQHGQVVQSAPEFVMTALHGETLGFSGATPYVKWGNSGVIILLVFMLGAGVFFRSKQKP